MANSQHFSELPDASFLDVLKHCRGVDVLSVQQASRRFCSLAMVPAVWRHILQREFRLELPKSCPYSSLKAIYRSMIESENKADLQNVEYWGTITDGGMDDNSLNFWVDNMFSGDFSEFYCSEMHRSSQVRCIGVSPPFVHDEQRVKNIVETMPRVHGSGNTPLVKKFGARNARGSLEITRSPILLDRATLNLLQNKPKESGALVAVNRGVRIGRMGGLTCPISCGVMFIGNYDFSSIKGGANDLSSRLYMLSKSATAATFSRLTDLDSILAACKNNEIDLPVAVSFGAGGVWVEFVVHAGTNLTGESLEAFTGSCVDLYAIGAQSAKQMQPLLWFKFYEKGEDVADSTIRDHFIAEFSSMGVTCGIVREKVKPVRYNAVFQHIAANQDGMGGGIDIFEQLAAGNEGQLPMDVAGASDSDLGAADQDAAHSGAENEETASASMGNSSLEARNNGDLMSHPLSPTCLSTHDQVDNESNEMFVSAASISGDSSLSNEDWNDPESDLLAEVEEQQAFQDAANAPDPADEDNEMLNEPDASASIFLREDTDMYDLYNLQTPSGERTYWTLASMARREMMDIKFHNPVVGNCVCLLINTCENLMQVMEDSHEGPNVDVNFMWMLGETVKVVD